MHGVMDAQPSFDQNMYLPLHPCFLKVIILLGTTIHQNDQMDGIGGCVRNLVYHTMMAGRQVIKSPKEFAECVQKLVKGIHCYYLPIEQVMEEPESIQNAALLVCTSFMYIWLEGRSQGLASIAFSCFTLPVTKKPSTTSSTIELTQLNLWTLWTKMKSRQLVPNA